MGSEIEAFSDFRMLMRNILYIMWHPSQSLQQFPLIKHANISADDVGLFTLLHQINNNLPPIEFRWGHILLPNELENQLPICSGFFISVLEEKYCELEIFVPASTVFWNPLNEIVTIKWL